MILQVQMFLGKFLAVFVVIIGGVLESTRRRWQCVFQQHGDGSRFLTDMRVTRREHHCLTQTAQLVVTPKNCKQLWFAYSLNHRIHQNSLVGFERDSQVLIICWTGPQYGPGRRHPVC